MLTWGGTETVGRPPTVSRTGVSRGAVVTPGGRTAVPMPFREQPTWALFFSRPVFPDHDSRANSTDAPAGTVIVDVAEEKVAGSASTSAQFM